MKKQPFIQMATLWIALWAGYLPAVAQNDQAYIYGEITTIDNQKYVGEIRWGDEEAFWDDIFNSSKPRNEFIKYIDRDEVYGERKRDEEDDGNKRWSISLDFGSVWVDGNRYGFANTHTLACRFGDLRQMEIVGRNAVELEFRDGSKMEVEGGSNDLGNSIRIYDAEIGEMQLRWDRIETIRFMETPKKLNAKFGNPLYGTVATSEGTFEGFILWDNDECLDTDKLDGDSDNGDLSIEFRNIRTIEAERRGSTVTLNSGRKLYLTGSNDVNEGNRGIVIKTPNFGRVLVKWREFDTITFSEPPTSGPAYNDFNKATRLRGKVITTKGDSFSGILAYDLDETWNWEMLDGEDDGFEYTIPFEKIKRIIPKNYNYTTVELRSGEELLLGETQDVTERNDGILIFKKEDDKDPLYVRWEDVEEIIFE